MILGIISDSHDNLSALQDVLSKLESKTDEIIHCGDAVSERAIQILEDSPFRVHLIRGNADTFSKDAIRSIDYYEHGAEIDIDGRAIFVSHFPEIARIGAMSPTFDVVFHGHTHVQNDLLVDGTHMVNPGEIQGRTGHKGYALYDTETNEVELKTLEIS